MAVGTLGHFEQTGEEDKCRRTSRIGRREQRKRDQCNLSDHPGFNKKGLWINSSAFATIKAKQDANGEPDKNRTLRTRRRIALRDQGIEWPKGTRPPTSRPSMEVPGRVNLTSMVTKLR